jgi:hypothetical protein
MKHFDILAVWGLSIVSFITSNEMIALFAIGASFTTIVKNLPGVIKVFKNLLKK